MIVVEMIINDCCGDDNDSGNGKASVVFGSKGRVGNGDNASGCRNNNVVVAV